MGPRNAWGHEALYWMGRTRANTATGAFGGAHYGVTKRCILSGRRMRTPLLGLSVEPPMSNETL
eukprot:8311328-Pyramimonas_sp.AAC.1